MGLLLLLGWFGRLRSQIGIVENPLKNPVGPVYFRGGEDDIEQLSLPVFVGDSGKQDALLLRQFLERLVLRGGQIFP